MNRKGFTLIELLAIIVVLSIVLVLLIPNIIGLFNKSKDKSYNILIEDIKIAGENYYQECEYGDLSDTSKYSNLACSISNKSTTVSLGNLVSLGILKASGNNNTIVNPKNKKNISSCTITITKVVGEHSKTTFNVSIPEKSCINN